GAFTGITEPAHIELTPVPRPPVVEVVPDADGIPGSDVFLVDSAETETSPWEKITVANAPGLDFEIEDTPRPTVRKAARQSGVPLWMMGVLTFGMLVGCLAALGLLVRTLAK